MTFNSSLFHCSCKHSLSILLLTVVLSSLSCSSSRHSSVDKPLPETRIGTNANEVKLGDSKFYLTVPDNIKITEARGKEGQHGFHILPKNNSFEMYGFIETQHGYPIEDSTYSNCNHTIYAKSILLNKQVTWTKICLLDNKYFNVEAKCDNGITVYAYADKRSDIDSLISIIGTLTEK